MVGSLSHRCSVSVLKDIRDAQRFMIGMSSLHVLVHRWSQTCHVILCPLSSDSVRPLLSLPVHDQLSAPSMSFDLTYDLGLVALCADFRENIEFQFSLGWTALVTRFIGATNAKRALSGSDPRLQVSSPHPLVLKWQLFITAPKVFLWYRQATPHLMFDQYLFSSTHPETLTPRE